MKKLKLTSLIAIFLISLCQGATPQEALETLLESKAIDKTQTAIYIWDIDAETPVVAYQTATPLVPASVMKCVTTGALGPSINYHGRLTTNVYLEGEFNDTLFNGNIVVVGCGDPTLGDGRHAGQENLQQQIALALKGNGVKRIEGGIVIDSSCFAGPPTPPSWDKADLSQSYGTGCHGFNFEGNASGKAAVKNPAETFRQRLTNELRNNKITISGTKTARTNAGRELLLSYTSPQFKDMMSSCMFRSDNLYAESFLRLFGILNGTDGSTHESALTAMQHWKNKHYPMLGVEIIDGSGLSRNNRLTAEFLGEVLKGLWEDPNYVSFFPLVGEEGTVRNFLKDTDLQEYLSLKTGSMRGIQSYAGYLLDEDYEPTHVVVVMTNNLKDRTGFRAALAKFFLSVFRPET